MVFCFCGRLGKEKNITLLLEYWAKNVRPEDKIKLFILGDGPLHEQHCKEADELGISDMVKFAGQVRPPIYPYITPAVTHISQRHSPIPAQYPCSRVWLCTFLFSALRTTSMSDR